MKKRTMHYVSLISLLILVTLACSVSFDLGLSTDQPDDSVGTSVAATLAARSAGEEQTVTRTPPQPAPATPTFTIHPTITASPPEPDVVYRGISFAFDPALAVSVNPETEEGQGDPENPWSTPDHEVFLFAGYPLGDAFHEPVIRVFPVEAFRAVNPMVGERLDHLETVLADRPAEPEVGVLHFFNAAQFIQAQVVYLEFQSGTGVRFLAQYGQAASPIGWPHLFYTFQGLTADGQYYISAVLPVTHPSLPHPDDVTLDEAFYDNFMAYAAEKEAELDAEAPGSFQPSLLLLDEMIESLRVEAE